MSTENKGLEFRISLRSDVYYLVRTSDESTDKIESSVIWYKWTNHEILVMLIKRIETFFGREVDERKLLELKQYQIAPRLNSIMTERFLGNGKWENAPVYRILMSLIRKRPRDLVKLCTMAATQAMIDKKNIIETQHLRAIFENYSSGRITDTVNEYKSELPDIERLILSMKPSGKDKKNTEGYIYTTSQLNNKIRNIISNGRFRFSNGKEANEKDLANFLYKINFLTARKELENGEIQRKYFDENQYINSSIVDFGFDWEIHPAYRWALQPSKINEIFYKMDLSSDD
jgi:hypothetical protein